MLLRMTDGLLANPLISEAIWGEDREAQSQNNKSEYI